MNIIQKLIALVETKIIIGWTYQKEKLSYANRKERLRDE